MFRVALSALLIGIGLVGCQVLSLTSLAGPRIVPWVECNWPDARLDPEDPESPTYFEHVVSGLLIWKEVTDVAVVSTMPGTADLYPRLRERVPGMRIIPGLKTNPILAGLDSVAGWELVAAEIRAIQGATDCKCLLLENEHALAPYANGERELDNSQLTVGLKQLPTELEYWWYPTGVYWFSTDYGPVIGPDMCRAIQAALPKVRFFDQRLEGREFSTFADVIAAAESFDALRRDPPVSHLFFYGRESRNIWWRDEEVRDALQCVRDVFGDEGVAVIYPGVERWPEAASSLTARLIED